MQTHSYADFLLQCCRLLQCPPRCVAWIRSRLFLTCTTVTVGRLSGTLYNLDLLRQNTFSGNMEPGDSGNEVVDRNSSSDCSLDDVHLYVLSKQYREGISTDQKRRIREKSVLFSDEDGVLIMRTNNGTHYPMLYLTKYVLYNNTGNDKLS